MTNPVPLSLTNCGYYMSAFLQSVPRYTHPRTFCCWNRVAVDLFKRKKRLASSVIAANEQRVSKLGCSVSRLWP